MKAALYHPLHLGAVALLVVNDQLLKYQWPGLVTGKLSDFAGVFVAAVVAAVVFDHRRAGVVAAGLGFAALKTSAVVAALAAPVLGGVTLQDGSDLLALVALVPADRFIRRVEDRDRPDNGDGWRRLAVVCAGAATVLTVTATSCLPSARVLGFVSVPDGILALGDEANHLSTDGGQTWQPTTIAADTGGSDDAAGTDATDQGCLSDGRCFQVIPETAVQEMVDGRWQDAFFFSESDREAIRYRTNDCTGQGSISETFGSLLVTSNDAGQEFVLVAMASQGALLLDPSTDIWSRVAVADAVPPSLSTPPPEPVRNVVALSPLILMLGSPLLLLVRRGRETLAHRIVATAIAAVSGGALMGLFLFLTLGGNKAQEFRIGLVLIALVLLVLALCLWLILSAKDGRAKDGAE